MEKRFAEYAAEKTLQLLAIDSPTGYTRKAAEWVKAAFEAEGCPASFTRKGAVLALLGGPEEGSEKNALLLEAHTDTLGAMVAEVKGNGRLRIRPIGGLNASNTETENVKVYTRSGKVFEGTIQLVNASAHVNGNLPSEVRTFDNVEVVLDEKVETAAEVKALGIGNGDFVCPSPRAYITDTGYIKSRFLDDKLSVGILLGMAAWMREKNIVPARRVYALITVYEEVGHGGSASVPGDVTEAISVDMGCVGEGLECTERMVSICAMDSGGPYDEEVTGRLIEAAKKEGADYAVDLYPHYGSDVEATLRAGYDIRHGLIGAGVYASHGYERSHIEGVWSTMKVLKGYLGL